MKIPFVKAQAVGNDFLIVEWETLAALNVTEAELPGLARRICHRHYGVGADGLEICGPPGGSESGDDLFIRLFNSDGSEAEISGNGTRCVAAYLTAERGAGERLRIATKAGAKDLRLIGRSGREYVFDMGMGRPRYREDEIGCQLETKAGPRTATLVHVGNPQCVLWVDDFDFDWRALGREIESLPHFPERTNVSFVKLLDRHTIDVRFWERGAGETMSSGTGATGAAVAAILSGKSESPVRVVTPAGDLQLRWEGQVTLRGPAEITAKGEYYGYPKAEPNRE